MRRQCILHLMNQGQVTITLLRPVSISVLMFTHMEIYHVILLRIMKVLRQTS